MIITTPWVLKKAVFKTFSSTRKRKAGGFRDKFLWRSVEVALITRNCANKGSGSSSMYSERVHTKSHNFIKNQRLLFYRTYQVNKEVLFGWSKVFQSANKLHDILLIPDNQVWIFLAQLDKPLWQQSTKHNIHLLMWVTQFIQKSVSRSRFVNKSRVLLLVKCEHLQETNVKLG